MAYIGNEPTSVAFLTDSFSGTGSQTAFTLSAAPANTSSILVAVSGVLQDPTTYSTTGTTLTFSAAPPSGTGNISVRFLGIPASGVTTTAYRTQTEFTATAGQTTFSVPSYTPGFIDVYRNGVLLSSTNFVATNGTTVVLNNAASAGDLVETVSFFVSSVINAIPAVAGAVNDTYLNTNAVTTTKIADSAVTTAKIADTNVTQAKLAAGVAGTGPAFSAYQTPSQSLSTGFQKILFTTEEFDTNSNFASSRFTPTVAGYYQLSSYVRTNGAPGGEFSLFLAKNTNNSYKMGNSTGQSGGITASGISVIVYANGTTDYFEIWMYAGGSCTTSGGEPYTWFTGALVRAA
jgi:hypothetical protein